MVLSIPWDSTQYNYTGIVGDEGYEKSKNATLFVHGNGRDATDWSTHFKYFTEKGMNGNELWAISFDNSKFTHSYLASQLEEFVENIFRYTEIENVSIISHSLGVTVSRYWLQKYDRYNDVNTFIGIAGANHGASLCPPKGLAMFLPESNRCKPCQSLSDKSITPTLVEELNNKVGETPGDVKYYTIRGSDDRFYRSCSESPRLEGAEENIVLDADHDEVRKSVESLENQYKWITENQ